MMLPIGLSVISMIGLSQSRGSKALRSGPAVGPLLYAASVGGLSPR